MFDRTVVLAGRTVTERVPYEKTVVEKRAPTDDSIRLYDEIKEKAYNSILGTIEIRDNSLNVVAILYEDFLAYHKVCKYRLKLNGKEITGEIRSSEVDLQDRQALLQEIVDKASRHIAVEILKTVKV